MSATYLLRFDDLSDTMNWAVWEGIEQTLDQEGISPILAVVPDNHDPGLIFDSPNPRFWDRVRMWQDKGWTIGLHGYQHLYVTDNPGIVGINSRSEFAGLPYQVQANKLENALNLFRRERVTPNLWVAPAHSFDRVTLRVLKERSLAVVSDGFSLYPYRDSEGVAWLPQQLWRFRRFPFGVWTICLHHNRWGDGELARFRDSLREYRSLFGTVDGALKRFGSRTRDIVDVVGFAWYGYAIRARGLYKRGSKVEST